ncbi:MAG TPA: hypothetical protein PK970_03730 [Hyphomicrobiaceae bacterium]|nr:hypothetical protein [Hyphomicrobiaceae bacterium]
MRHALGVLGVLAAGVLLAVSAAMNWRFGYTLGVSEFDKQIYGAASAAADCFKALIPFFLFAAIKNRMWSQVAASAVLWLVVTAYSLTSALGHAALNRHHTTGERAAQAATYKDLRAELKRAQDQLSWIPQHRPAQTVLSDIDGHRLQKLWTVTKGCADVTGPQGREFCQKFQSLNAELASAQQAEKWNGAIAEISAKLANVDGAGAVAEADPQAAVLAKLVSLLGFSVKTEDMQTALAVFVAVLLEIGSAFGLYVAFATWRLDHGSIVAPKMAQRREARVVEASVADEQPTPVETPVPAIAPAAAASPRLGVANDNRSAPKLTAPQTDVERFYKERIELAEGNDITATTLYEDYCGWCEEQHKEPLSMPSFGREFGDLGVRKAKIAGRVRYMGIGLRSGLEHEEDKKLPVSRVA